MEQLKFSTASDVWSLGIVMVELLQDGVPPYHNQSNPDVMRHVLMGNMHGQPPGCSDQLYAIMMLCWHQDPVKRPTFAAIIRKLEMFGLIGPAKVHIPVANGPAAQPPVPGGTAPVHRRALGFNLDIESMFHDGSNGYAGNSQRSKSNSASNHASNTLDVPISPSQMRARARSVESRDALSLPEPVKQLRNRVSMHVLEDADRGRIQSVVPCGGSTCTVGFMLTCAQY